MNYMLCESQLHVLYGVYYVSHPSRLLQNTIWKSKCPVLYPPEGRRDLLFYFRLIGLSIHTHLVKGEMVIVMGGGTLALTEIDVRPLTDVACLFCWV